MKRHRHLIILCALLLSVLAYGIILAHSSKIDSAGEIQVEARPLEDDHQTIVANARFRDQSHSAAIDVARTEAGQRAWSQLQARSRPARIALVRTLGDTWAAVIATNWPAYQALCHSAVAAPTGSTQCTICGGLSTMSFCVLCNGLGKCPVCAGTGTTPSHDEPCPVCLGSGKCYICFGGGRMPCPFCNDGVITRKSPATPPAMPL